MAAVVETSGGAEKTSGSSEETSGGAEADGTEPDITDTRLIGLRILPVISRSEYGWLGFEGRERGRRRGAVGAGRAQQEGGEAARVWGAVESPVSLREAGNN
jgi:hypothetical protein